MSGFFRMFTRRILSFVCWTLLFVLVLFPAMDMAAQERRSFSVWVTDKEGHLVEGLTVQNFRGKFRGNPVQIESVVLQDETRAIAVLLDISNSIKKRPRMWDLLWNAGENFMLSVQPPHEIAFFTFWHGILFHGVVTAEQKENVSDFLKELKKRSQNRDGGTALYDAIIFAVRSAPKTGWSADTIYVISDGEDHLSYSTSAAVQREVVEAGIRLFFPLSSFLGRCSPPAQTAGTNSAQTTKENCKRFGGCRIRV